LGHDNGKHRMDAHEVVHIKNGGKIRGLAAFPDIQDCKTSQLISDALAVRTLDGVSGWMERFRAVGNSQVPRVAATAEVVLAGLNQLEKEGENHE